MTRSCLLGTPLIGILAACALGTAGPGYAQAEKPVDYRTQVRPILAGYCYGCHGEDAKKREAGLRLDLKAFAFADVGGYPNIVPGDPAESELYLRISAVLAEERMPPYRAGTTLSAEQIETIRMWIEEGAEWPDD
jgi:mono/diheme cytochrome c family protein